MDFTPYLTAMVMLLGILVGTLISPRIQHRVGLEHSRKDLIFQRKLKYFEYIAETIERNKKLYSILVFKIEDSKTRARIEEILEELKKERKKFFIMASPLYFNTKAFSEKIIRFVRIEKNIFNGILRLKEKDVNKKIKEKVILHLREDVKRLDKKGEEILLEMKRELLR